jgi:hypothetical protein
LVGGVSLAIGMQDAFPDLAALFPPTDFFMNQIVRSVLVEVPAEITGLRRLNYWATTAIYDEGHGWLQLQRTGGPNGTTLWNFPAGPAGININATVPSQDLVILNQDFVSGLTQPAKLLDYFPYLSPPPES